MMVLPDPQQTHWTTYVYYVVNVCTCGHSYYYPSRRQIRFDELTPQRLHQEIAEIPRRMETHCGQCGRRAMPEDARRAVLGLGMPDRSGCILCDFTMENGHIKYTRFRFDKSPDPIQFFREHPDYFRTKPPDNSPTELDDQLCLMELGRVLNVRSAWNHVLHDAIDYGAAFMQVQQGYYLFATTAAESHDIECQMRELADESFWYHFQRETIPRRRLMGIDRWDLETRQRAHLEHGTYNEWLAPDLVDAMQNNQVTALTFTIDSTSLQYVGEAAGYYQVEVDELLPADGGAAEWWIRNAQGVSRPSPPLELMQLDAIYRGALLSDNIWMNFKHLAKSLEHESNVKDRFCQHLPPGYSAEWSDPGKLLISRGDHPMEILTFAHIADQIDPQDEEALSRLISWLVGGKSCECHRYVGKRLMSRSRFEECSAEFLQDPDAFLYHEREDELIEIYTDECEHHVIYGLRRAEGNIQKAEALFQRDLDEQSYDLRYIAKRSFLRGVQMVALLGRDAASISAHPALLRGALDELKVRFGNRIQIFAPFNGILAIAAPNVEADKLKKFAYDVAQELPEEPELKSDHLGYHATLEVAEEPIGSFHMELYSSRIP